MCRANIISSSINPGIITATANRWNRQPALGCSSSMERSVALEAPLDGPLTTGGATPNPRETGFSLISFLRSALITGGAGS